MIQLLADEKVEGRVIRLLRSEGYSVTSIQETQSGVADETVLETSVSSATVLLTGDSDFGKLHFQKGHTHSRSGHIILPVAPNDYRTEKPDYSENSAGVWR